MDTILVVNAGSSSVKFQVFAVEGEGRLRRQIKGQMDGIGSRPRLRASGPTGDPLADLGDVVASKNMLIATGNVGKFGTGQHTWAGNYKGALMQASSWSGPGVGDQTSSVSSSRM